MSKLSNALSLSPTPDKALPEPKQNTSMVLPAIKGAQSPQLGVKNSPIFASANKFETPRNKKNSSNLMTAEDSNIGKSSFPTRDTAARSLTTRKASVPPPRLKQLNP